MDNANRPPIPLAVKREVRQRCGFGCVICGLPIYEYDHLLGWASVHRHVADEITLLCDRHHREKTSGLLTDTQVARANENPHNFQAEFSPPWHLNFEGYQPECVIGSNLLTVETDETGCFAAVVIDDYPVIWFKIEDGALLFNLDLRDEYNQPIVVIDSNELVFCIDTWDVELVGQRLIVRNAHRDIRLEIAFEPPRRIVITRGRILLNGVKLEVRPDSLLLGNNTLGISYSMVIGHTGLLLGYCPGWRVRTILSLPHLWRYGGEDPEPGPPLFPTSS